MRKLKKQSLHMSIEAYSCTCGVGSCMNSSCNGDCGCDKPTISTSIYQVVRQMNYDHLNDAAYAFQTVHQQDY